MYANVNATVGVLESMHDASNIQESKWNDTVFPVSTDSFFAYLMTEVKKCVLMTDCKITLKPQ